MDFETFLVISAMCDFHDKFSSRKTPKNIDSLTRLIVYWLISSILRFSLFCLGLKTIKCDLIIFTESLLARHQSVKLSNSSLSRQNSNSYERKCNLCKLELS